MDPDRDIELDEYIGTSTVQVTSVLLYEKMADRHTRTMQAFS